MGCLALLLYFPALIFARGWAIKTVWNWYVPTIFANAPSVSMAAALGIATLVGMFTASPSMKSAQDVKDKKADKSDLIVGFLMPFVWTAFSVFFAWFYRHWL